MSGMAKEPGCSQVYGVLKHWSTGVLQSASRRKVGEVLEATGYTREREERDGPITATPIPIAINLTLNGLLLYIGWLFCLIRSIITLLFTILVVRCSLCSNNIPSAEILWRAVAPG
jgi:hypothetical protein